MMRTVKNEEAKLKKDVKDRGYERINQEMKKWPNWKKEAYNEMFANSRSSKKIV